MRRPSPVLDRFRLLAAVLVAAIHTSPLTTYTAPGDFYLTRVLGRVAVPFFLMVSGYFLDQKGWRTVWPFWKKTALLYGVCVLLYLPLNLYAGQLDGDFFRRLVTDGTFYHLWYFPGLLLGIPIAWRLRRLGLRLALPLAGLLYLVGLGGDSYYGLAAQIPALETVYSAIFQVFSYTRNGLFYVPLFLLLGTAGRRFSRRATLAGFLLSLAAMSGEALWLHSLGVQRHDSMYLFLPLAMLFLFSPCWGLIGGRIAGAAACPPWCMCCIPGASSWCASGRSCWGRKNCWWRTAWAISALCWLSPSPCPPPCWPWRPGGSRPPPGPGGRWTWRPWPTTPVSSSGHWLPARS